jgi:CRISPR-associated endonuclease/helicase Cas3
MIGLIVAFRDPFMSACSRLCSTFWGKTRDNHGGAAGWHPLAYHCLNVAAVGSVLLGQHRMPDVDTSCHPGLVTLLAWHDIGKFTRQFQCKVEALWPTALGRFQPLSGWAHDTAGYRLLNDQLADITESLLPGWGNSGKAMLRAACGHHGRPPHEIDPLSSGEACETCIAAARSFAAEAMLAVGGQPLPFMPRQVALRLAWKLAALQS